MFGKTEKELFRMEAGHKNSRRNVNMIINHNLMAMNTHRQLGMNNTAGSKSLEKLSSGFRINRAGDDAAGLAISEKMRGQIRGLSQASRNAQDGISLIQTAEGALNETHAILQRMRELAVQSATDTNTAADRSKIQAEVDQLAKEITRISNTTEFNTRNLLAGGLSTIFHIGANEGQNVDSSIGAMDAFSLGVAAAKNMAGAFDAGETGIESGIINSELGSGLTAQTYNIVVTTEDSTAAGNGVTFTNDNAFTGARDEEAIFKVIEVDDDDRATTVHVSLDGGTTYNTVGIEAITQVTGGGEFVYKGVTVNITDDTEVGKEYSIEFTAQYDTLQLQDAADINIGDAVNVYSDMESVVIGNASTGQTMVVRGSNFGDLEAGTATQEVSSLASTKAVIGTGGEVVTEAEVVAGVDVSTQAAADKAITIINNALETVSAERSKLGAMQNRLEHTIANLDTSSENLQASESRIRDVDMAKEMMEFTKNSILQQAATAMLAQANQQPQSVLQLLR
jgi:flagellin